MSVESIKSELTGVGDLLQQNRLYVPEYQRPYMWETSHVRELFNDITDAKDNGAEQYFLGTVVLTNGEYDGKNIIDGQQRIVTLSIVISAIVDFFDKNKDEIRVKTITQDYMSSHDLKTKNLRSKVNLCSGDQNFYERYVVKREFSNYLRAPNKLSESQKKIFNAFKEVKSSIREIEIKEKDISSYLVDLVQFIAKKAVVVCLSVGSNSNAYMIFEVLNDRGLDLNVADLLKNYIFNLSGKEYFYECQKSWNEMTFSISKVYGEKETKNFIRQEWISKNGLVREKSLYDEIKKKIKDGRQVRRYMERIHENSLLYSDFKDINANRWKQYSEEVREGLSFFNTAKIRQIRPLLLAIFNKFNKKEINITIPMLVSWSVRFLIGGSGGNSMVEDGYARSAQDVSRGEIRNSRELYEGMSNILISDKDFQNAFAKAKSSNAQLARWYLCELENEMSRSNEKVANRNPSQVNLEHILPQSSYDSQKKDSENHINRIGNLTLLENRINSEAGNKCFTKKRDSYEKSHLVLNKYLSSKSSWGKTEIEERQSKLAEYAVRRWSIEPRCK